MVKCTLCELCEKVPHQLRGRFIIDEQERDGRKAKVVIIGDFPHMEDYKEGRVFAGPVFTELSQLLAKLHYPMRDVYLTTLVKCRPVAPNHMDGMIKKSNIDTCSVHLSEELADLEPELLILLGDKVFHHFYPNESFTDSRGKIQTCDLYDIKTIATYHPLAMVSSSKFDQIIRNDLKTAIDHLTGKTVCTKSVKDYKFVVNSLDLLQKIAERVKTVETFAFDIETHGTGLFNYKLLSVGLSWKKDTGVSIPFYVKDEDKANALQKAQDYVIPNRTRDEVVIGSNGKSRVKKVPVKGLQPEDYINLSNIIPDEYGYILGKDTLIEIKREISAILDQEPPLKRYWGDKHNEAMRLLKDIMECATPKGAHNGAFDVNRLRGKGIIVKNYAWDTILMHHLLDEDRPHGLDDLSFVYTEDGGYKSEKNIYLNSSKTSWANIPMNVLLPYNAQDADVTLQLYYIFKDKLQNEGKLWKLFINQTMPAQHMLLDMSFRGSDVDVNWVKNKQKEYREKMKELKIEFQQVAGTVYPNCYVVDSPEEQKDVEREIKQQATSTGTEPKFPNFLNMNSTQQLIVLFRDYYKVPLKKKTKSGDALDSDVLKKIGKKNKAAQILLEYKALKKVDSTYFDSLLNKIDADGKIHTEYKLYGTATGRLASSNPNCQNLPSEVKPMFIPPSSDYVCVNVDQSAAELHVLAWLANDRRMIDIFEKGRDLHRETAAGVFGKKMEDITPDERKIAKRCFSKDEFILTDHGYIRGRDLGDNTVLTLDCKTQKQHHVFEERDGYKITLRNGMVITVTKDHKFLDFKHINPVYKEANEFKVGDVLGFRKDIEHNYNPVYIDNTLKLKTRTNRLPEKVELDNDLAYLLGLYLGDGSLMFNSTSKTHKGVQFVVKHESRDYILNTLSKKYPITIAKNFDTYSAIQITSAEWSVIFDKLCGHKKEKHIPDEMFRAPKHIVDSFISGLIDSDGSTSRGLIRFRNTNENMVRGLCTLATLYGYAVVYATEKYDTTIKMNKDPNKRYTGITHICTFVSKPDLELRVASKKAGLNKKTAVNNINTWPILLSEFKNIKGKCKDTGYNNYRDGHQKGLTDKSVAFFNFAHKNYWSSEIISVEETRFTALVMETETHFFVGDGLDSPNCSFGTAYGISGRGLADLLEPEGVKITESQGNKYIKKWRETYPACAKFLDSASRNFVRYHFLETPFGRRRHKHKTYLSSEKESAAARQACNYPIQSTASDIQLYEMVHMYDTLLANGVLPVFTVHDSIVMYCPKNKLRWLRDYYKQETCRRFKAMNNLLMYTEMEVGRNYGEHVGLPYDCDFDKWCEENKHILDTK